MKNLIPEYYYHMIEDSKVFACGILDDGMLVGAVIYKVESNAASLRYLFILPEYRRQGATKGAIKYLKSLFEYTQMDAIEAEISPEDNPEAFSLMEECGFQPTDTSTVVTAQLKDIFQDEKLIRTLEPYSKEKLLTYPETLEVDRHVFGNYLLQNQLYSYINPDEIIQDASFFHKGSKIDACVLSGKFNDQLLTLSFLYNGSKEKNYLPLLLLLRTYIVLRKKFGEDAYIMMACQNEVSLKIAEMVCRNMKKQVMQQYELMIEREV